MTRLRRLLVVPLPFAILFDLVSTSSPWLVLVGIVVGIGLQFESELVIRAWTTGVRRRAVPARRYGAWLLAAAAAGGFLAFAGQWSATLAWGLVVFVGVIAGLQRITIDRLLVGLAVAVAVLLPLGLWGDGAEILLMFATFVACTVSIAIGTMRRQQDERVQHARDLMRTEERARIAVDLHDLVAHEVTGIVVLAQAAGAVTTDTSAAQAFTRIEDAAQRALGEIRELVARTDEAAALAPGAGLAVLRDLADRFAESMDVPVEVSLGDAEPPPAIGAELQRVLAESLTNVRRHARPSTVVIRLDHDDTEYRLVVANDGAAEGGIGPGNRSGIARLQERAALLGGVLRAVPTGAGSWETELRLPLELR